MRKAFGKTQLEKIFSTVGGKLPTKIDTYLLGGGAMAFRNQKTATKDLDLVFTNKRKCELFEGAIKDIGFSEKTNVESQYSDMKAAGIWENEDGFRFDLFVKRVCGALELTENMIYRSVVMGRYGKLTVNIVSNEDIILFKAITQRDDDAADIVAIIRNSDIDWNVVFDECSKQSKNRSWYGPILDKFYEIDEKYKISVPIVRKLEKINSENILKEAYLMRKNKGMNKKNIIEALSRMGFTKKEIENSLE